MKVKFLGKQIRKEEFQALMEDVEEFSIYLNQRSEEEVLEFYSKAQFVYLNSKHLIQHELVISQHLEKQSSSFLKKTLEVLESLHNSQEMTFLVKMYLPLLKPNTYIMDFFKSIEEHITTILQYRNLQDKLVNIPTQESNIKVNKI